MNITNVKIENLANGGAGIARIEGKACFIPYTVPGDEVEVTITSSKKTYSHGELTRLISPSPDRTEPFCTYYGDCGGCNWQHINYNGQLKAKQQLLASTLEKIGGITFPVPAMAASPKTKGYRNSVHLHIDKNRNIGFFRPNSHSVAAITACPLVVPQINKRLEELIPLVKTMDPAPISVHLYCSESGELKEFIQDSAKPRELPFHQINHGVNRILQDKVASIVTETALSECRILDLYAGDGNLSLQFGTEQYSSLHPHILGVESSGKAVRSANKTAAALTAESNSENIEYIREDAAKFLKAEKYRAARKLGFSHIILDPPRNGLKGLVGGIAALQAPVCIYISCSPPDMARDISKFTTLGYQLKSLQPIDMFPQTSHTETIAVLRRD